MITHQNTQNSSGVVTFNAVQYGTSHAHTVVSAPHLLIPSSGASFLLVDGPNFHTGNFPRRHLSRSKVIKSTHPEAEMSTETENDISDEQLFKQFVGGDQDAFSVLVSRYQAALHRYAKQELRDSNRADEIVQLTFVRAIEHKDSFIDGKVVRPWLYTIAHRLIRDSKKSVARRSKIVKSFTDIGDAARDNGQRETDAILTEGVSPAADVEIEEQEFGAKAMRLLRRLPQHLRNAVELAVLRDVPTRAAGPLMRVSHMQVGNRLRSALAILKKGMEAFETDDADIEHSLVEDCLDALDAADKTAIERVVNEDCSASDADRSVFATFIRRLVGEVA